MSAGFYQKGVIHEKYCYSNNSDDQFFNQKNDTSNQIVI